MSKEQNNSSPAGAAPFASTADAPAALDIAALVKRARAAANGLGSLKDAKGDYGLCDSLADAIEHLCAANADLLGALRGRDPDEPPCIQPLSWLRSLIDDARERGPAPTCDDLDAYDMMLREVEDFHARCRAAITKATET